MIFNLILLILSIATDLGIYFGLQLHLNVMFLWLPLLMLPFIFALLFGLEMVILFIWTLFLDKKNKPNQPNKLYLWIVYQVNQQIIYFSGARFKITGLEKLPKNENYILLYNHRSNLDPMILMHHIKNRNFVCLSKNGNERIPIAGPFIFRGGFITFNRDDTKECIEATFRSIKTLRKTNYALMVAPEGKRNKDASTTLLPFLNGSFKIALKSQKPLVIATLKNAEKIAKGFPYKSVIVHIDIVKSISYDEYKHLNEDELNNLTYNMMKNNLEANNHDLHLI